MFQFAICYLSFRAFLWPFGNLALWPFPFPPRPNAWLRLWRAKSVRQRRPTFNFQKYRPTPSRPITCARFHPRRSYGYFRPLALRAPSIDPSISFPNKLLRFSPLASPCVRAAFRSTLRAPRSSPLPHSAFGSLNLWSFGDFPRAPQTSPLPLRLLHPGSRSRPHRRHPRNILARSGQGPRLRTRQGTDAQRHPRRTPPRHRRKPRQPPKRAPQPWSRRRLARSHSLRHAVPPPRCRRHPPRHKARNSVRSRCPSDLGPQSPLANDSSRTPASTRGTTRTRHKTGNARILCKADATDNPRFTRAHLEETRSHRACRREKVRPTFPHHKSTTVEFQHHPIASNPAHGPSPRTRRFKLARFPPHAALCVSAPCML